MYNHYENISVLSTKAGLLKTLRDYYSLNKQAVDCNYRVHDTLPQAYIITSNPNDYEFFEFKKKFANIEKGYVYNEKLTPKQYDQNFWLLKPTNMNQGKGIEIFNSMKQVYSFLLNKPQEQLWIVQKYIERPLLYHQRKFDIRVLALGTNEFDLHFYNIGYMRTSSDAYTLDNKNKFIHLTNNCYQKNSNNYQKFEQGNQLTFSQFQDYLDQTFPELEVKFEDLMLRIKDLVIDCFVAGLNHYNPKNRENIFEVMGYDFMIDEDFRVWLIEVNTNPYFGVLNDNLPKFIDNLVDDTFKLTVDKIFPRELDDSDRKSEYELLYSQKQIVNKRRPFNEGIYPVQKIKDKLDLEREQYMQKMKANKEDVNQSTNQTLLVQNGTQIKNKLKINKNFYMTIEGSTRSKSALSFGIKEGQEGKKQRKKQSKKFKQNINFNNSSAIQSNDDIIALSNQNSKVAMLAKNISPISENKHENRDKDYADGGGTTKNTMASTQLTRPHQQPLGTTSLSILLRKKAEENQKNSFNQNEYLNKIQRMLKVKNLVDQIKESISNVGENFEQKRKEFNKLFTQIFQILSNPATSSKKDVNTAIQGLRHLIFSQFIIHFNDKAVILKLFDIMRNQNNQHPEIKENIAKYLHELSKHISIRELFLNRKVLSRFTKILIDTMISVEDGQINKEYSKLLLQQLLIVSSISNSKYYIPGETKEIEQLRKKSIMNGVMIISDMIINLCKDTEVTQKLKSELFENLEIGDFRLNIFTIYYHFKNYLDSNITQENNQNFNGQTSPRTSRETKVQYDVEELKEKLKIIEQDLVFMGVISYIDSNFKQFKSRLPSILEQQIGFFNIDYLITQFERYKLHYTNLSKDATLALQVYSSNTGSIKTPNKNIKTLARNDSSKRIVFKSNQDYFPVQTSTENTETYFPDTSKPKNQNKTQTKKKSDRLFSNVDTNQNTITKNQKSELIQASNTFYAQAKAHSIKKHEANRNSQPNNKSFEKIKDTLRDGDMLQRPAAQENKSTKIKSLRTNLVSNTLLPILSQENYEQSREVVNALALNYNTSKDQSLVLPTLGGPTEQNSTKKQTAQFGVNGNFYNPGIQNKVIQDAQLYLKLQPYLQNNSVTSKSSGKKNSAKGYPKNEYQNHPSNQSSLILGIQIKKDESINILPLTSNIMKNNYYKSGFMSKVKKNTSIHQSEAGTFYNNMSNFQNSVISFPLKKASQIIGETLPSELRSERTLITDRYEPIKQLDTE
ncbi:tubulin-tyrosine ligase family protein [Stylonychia lemnae]|uniref:Tubulin-tyrosine ligase family protein n=1 Tax=Stylonychia lemnae TaxID=5949 RepID=A0A078A045_STYLE|nr:tubulin-tyrosine ligase family protein [Stylonychia lemnae]|eukprot:CDW75515.1 tubulin-tyrosine ligase family protein [Stylonychia lemnae]